MTLSEAEKADWRSRREDVDINGCAVRTDSLSV